MTGLQVDRGSSTGVPPLLFGPGPMDPTKPLPRESAKAFEAFCAYRDMGPGRSVAKVGLGLGKSTTLMARWSGQWAWVARVATWDADTAVKVAMAQQEEIVEMRSRHARISAAILGKVVSGLAKLDPGELKPGELTRMFDVAMKAERASRGASSETRDARPVVTTEHPLDNLSPAEIFARVETWKARFAGGIQ
jgi:hypothetical protein